MQLSKAGMQFILIDVQMYHLTHAPDIVDEFLILEAIIFWNMQKDGINLRGRDQLHHIACIRNNLDLIDFFSDHVLI